MQTFTVTTGFRRRALMLSLGALGLFAVSPSSWAQDAYPSRALRLIVPYPPGAVTDAMSRPVALELGKALGQSVVIENRPGAGTLVGTQAAKQAPADGYTLLYQASTLVTNLYTMKQPGYTLADFTPVAMLGQGAFVLMTSTKHPFNTLQDLVAYGKANPGKLNYSTTGPGSPASIVSYRFGQAAGINWVEIPFKGGADATQAVMAGDSHAFAASQGAPLIHANPDKMRMAAITAETRSSLLPNVPTFKELGYPVVLESWSALFVRSDTPAPIIEKLRTTLVKIMASEEVKQTMKGLGVEHYPGKMEDLPAQMQKELDEFTEDQKKQGIQPQ